MGESLGRGAVQAGESERREEWEGWMGSVEGGGRGGAEMRRALLRAHAPHAGRIRRLRTESLLVKVLCALS